MVFKKAILSISIFLLSFSSFFVVSVFADHNNVHTAQQGYANNMTPEQKTAINQYSDTNYGKPTFDNDGNLIPGGPGDDGLDGDVTQAMKAYSEQNNAGTTTASTTTQSSLENCSDENCISSTNFTINVGKLTPTGTDSFSGDAEANINTVLSTFIQKMIVAFGVLSLLVMTIGAGFMIIYHGQDELLTRGKSIFTYGLIALVVALSSGLLVNLVSYLLYQG